MCVCQYVLFSKYERVQILTQHARDARRAHANTDTARASRAAEVSQVQHVLALLVQKRFLTGTKALALLVQKRLLTGGKYLAAIAARIASTSAARSSSRERGGAGSAALLPLESVQSAQRKRVRRRRMRAMRREAVKKEKKIWVLVNFWKRMWCQ